MIPDLEKAMEILEKHPPVIGLILGIIAEDGLFRIDAAGYVSEKDCEKEAKKFIKYRKFVLKELTNDGS